jgi:DNA-directed RNA polymerase specialized sigma24 family protein
MRTGVRVDRSESDDFEEFAREAHPRLVRAFVAGRGDDAPEAAAEALAYAWEHWADLRRMENPMGYLYRVGQSRTRTRRSRQLPAPEAIGLPDFEPRLIPALLELVDSQRTAVWLVHGCGWQYAEVAAAMNTSASMVGNNVRRALAHLRRALEVESCA